MNANSLVSITQAMRLSEQTTAANLDISLMSEQSSMT